MQEILEAIEKGTDPPGTFKRLEGMISSRSSAALRPAIVASVEAVQRLDLQADGPAIEPLNRVWTQFCEKSSGDGAFLYDRVLGILEATDWDDDAAATRAYKLLVAFRGKHLDFLGYNTNLCRTLRAKRTRLIALIERLLKLEDRQLFAIERSIHKGRLGETVGSLLQVFSQHSNWRGDDDLRAAAAAWVLPAVAKFPYLGDNLMLGLLQHSPDCDRLLAQIVDSYVAANQPGGLLRTVAREMMNGLRDDLAKRIPGMIPHLAPLAARWTPGQADLAVERFFEHPFSSDRERGTALARLKPKRALGEMIVGLGHETPKQAQLAKWLGRSAARQTAAQSRGAAKPPGPAGAKFRDFNFKLLVIEALMYEQKVLKPKFDVRAFAKKHLARAIDVEKEGYAAIPEARQHFQDLAISQAQLAKVKRLAVDGGARVYLEIIPFWDGEDDAFDITSVDDAALLPNLKVFDFGDARKLRKKVGPALQKRGIKVLPA